MMYARLTRASLFLFLSGLLTAGGCAKQDAPQAAPPEVTVAKVISRKIKDWMSIRVGFRPWTPSRCAPGSPAISSRCSSVKASS
jgi:hypothetical protein